MSNPLSDAKPEEMLPCEYHDGDTVDPVTLECLQCGYNFTGINYYDQAQIAATTPQVATTTATAQA